MKNENVIKIRVATNPCGKELLKPDNNFAHTILKLTKTKTFSREHIKTLLELGYEVEIS